MKGIGFLVMLVQIIECSIQDLFNANYIDFINNALKRQPYKLLIGCFDLISIQYEETEEYKVLKEFDGGHNIKLAYCNTSMAEEFLKSVDAYKVPVLMMVDEDMIYQLYTDEYFFTKKEIESFLTDYKEISSKVVILPTYLTPMELIQRTSNRSTHLDKIAHDGLIEYIKTNQKIISNTYSLAIAFFLPMFFGIVFTIAGILYDKDPISNETNEQHKKIE